MDSSLVLGCCSSASFLCGFCDGETKNEHFNKFQSILAILFLAVDIFDFALDAAFIDGLWKAGKRGWSVLMIYSIGFPFLFVLAAPRAGQNALWFKDRNNRLLRLSMMCAVELSVFLIEDVTTVFIFTQVDGLYDPNSLADNLNVFSTIISASIAFLGTIPLTIRMFNSKFSSPLTFVVMIGPMVAVAFFSYLLLGKVYQQDPLSGVLRGITIALYVIFYPMGYFWISFYFGFFPAVVDLVDQEKVTRNFLATIGTSLQKDFELNESGVFAFTYEHLTFVLEAHPGAPHIWLYTNILKLSDIDGAKDVMVMALRLNSSFVHNGGGFLALDTTEEQDIIMFAYRCRLSGKSVSDFRTILENFIDTSLFVEDILRLRQNPQQKQVKMIDEGCAHDDFQDNIDFITESYGNANAMCFATCQKFEKQQRRLDENNKCSFEAKGKTIVWHFCRDKPYFFITSTLGGLGDYPNDDPVVRRLLKMNYLQKETRGGILTIHGKQKQIVFSLMDRVDETSGRDLLNYHEDFSRLASKEIPEKLQVVGGLNPEQPNMIPPGEEESDIESDKNVEVFSDECSFDPLDHSHFEGAEEKTHNTGAPCLQACSSHSESAYFSCEEEDADNNSDSYEKAETQSIVDTATGVSVGKMRFSYVMKSNHTEKDGQSDSIQVSTNETIEM